MAGMGLGGIKENGPRNGVPIALLSGLLCQQSAALGSGQPRGVAPTVSVGVPIARLYRDGKEWKATDGFGRNDLPLAGKALDMARTWIHQQAVSKATVCLGEA
jgi:hypothetical protein